MGRVRAALEWVMWVVILALIFRVYLDMLLWVRG